MNITRATYAFNGYGLNIEEFKVIRKTKKCYFAETTYDDREYIFKKKEIGKVRFIMRNYCCPFLEIIMIDANENELKEKLAEWFEETANSIRK